MGALTLNPQLGQEFETKSTVTPRTGATAETQTRTTSICD
jgi:hypothetical protein